MHCLEAFGKLAPRRHPPRPPSFQLWIGMDREWEIGTQVGPSAR
jgi:hypothetical protein